MTQQDTTSPLGKLLFEALIEEWSGDHGEFDDLSIDSADELREYLDRAVGRCTATGKAIFAVATRLTDGRIRALSKHCATRAEAERELSALLGDDYYRDQCPFIAAGWETQWLPLPATHDYETS